MAILGWLVALAGIFILGPIWTGYILSVLWTWFIMPEFHVAALSIPLAIGISGIIRFMTFQVPASQEKKKDSNLTKAFFTALGWCFLYPLYVLLAGYIVHLFV